MAYGSIEGVEALFPIVGDLDETTTPKSSQVTTWLAQGYSIINRAILDKGYQTPVLETSAIYDELVYLNNLFCHYLALRARGLDTITGEEQDKATILEEAFNEQLKDLCNSNLANMGLTPITGNDEDIDGKVFGVNNRLGVVKLSRRDGYNDRQFPDF